MKVCRPSARAAGGASAGAWAALTGAGPSPAPSASRPAARGEPASSSPPLRVYRPTASTTSPVTVASRPRQAVAALRVAYPRTVNSGAVPATNTAMVAAPAHGEPEVSARASTDRVTPHGISTDARPSAAGASADCERARPRTNRLHDAGGVTVMPRKPGTPSWASPNTTMRTPAAICAMVRSPTESSTVAPRAPRAAPSRVWEASLPARNPPTGARSSANRPDTDTGADAPAEQSGDEDSNKVHNVDAFRATGREHDGRPIRGTKNAPGPDAASTERDRLEDGVFLSAQQAQLVQGRGVAQHGDHGQWWRRRRHGRVPEVTGGARHDRTGEVGHRRGGSP